ncbi:MAG: cold shock domain-containing protein [Nanoarchaeota archaeon]|nr:cold shock domain-containing protein [Nanoarchaeota archaeon]MBU1854235.1 cold shock domain-containing protein [Nanoarchaeota archaeon]
MRINGRVQFWKPENNWGFISGDDKKSYFVHKNDLGFLKEVFEGDRLSFEPVMCDRGLKATKVEIENVQMDFKENDYKQRVFD